MLNLLPAEFTGRIIFPGESEYDQARKVFAGGFDRKPAAIIRVADAADVARAIAFAKQSGLPLSIKSGGHSAAAYSVCDNGVVIDMHDMRSVQIDAANKTAWAETGLTAYELTQELDKQNFVLGFGDTGSVGIGGITLGGGIGFLARKYGLTIDNLLAAEIVTADGQTLQVDSENHPDLFWAIRGGGGNFGVVTKFKYQLHELKEAFGGLLFLPATPEVISGFMALADKAPEELSTIINIMPAPPMPMIPAEHHGKLAVMAIMMYAGNPEDGEKALAPIRALAVPLADLLRPMRYKDIYFPPDDSYHPKALATTMMMKSVDVQLAQTMIEHLNNSDAKMRAVQLRVLGGAVSRVAAEATAYAHRNSLILANIATFYDTEEEKPKRQAWVSNLSKALYQGDDGAYVGFIGPDEEARVRAVYPEATWHRLSEVKKLYDPANLFNRNVNIHS
jgi:hypothetical protein